MSRDILLADIDRDPEQPRTHFDEAALQELADSMNATGQAVPITVKPAGARYTIVQGERRWRAAQLLGWATIRAEVQDLDAATAMWRTLVENIQRADLTPIEEAVAYQKLVDAGHTQTEIARRIGKTQSYVAQKLRLLKMPEHLRMYLSGLLSEGHARQLLRLQGIYATDAVTMPFQPEKPWRIETADDIQMFFVIIRPLEYPIAMIKNPLPHAAMVKAFGEAVAATGWEVPAWQVAAFYYAAVAVDRGWSVATLARQIDLFQELLYSAIVSLPGTDSALYWSYHGDLHHATHRTVDDLPLDIVKAAYAWSFGNGVTLPYPSIVQCGGATVRENGDIEIAAAPAKRKKPAPVTDSAVNDLMEHDTRQVVPA